MSDCCASSGDSRHPHRHRCPTCGMAGTEVSARTIWHHIRRAWQWENKNQRYFYCDDPACDVVYFAEDDSVIPASQLRIKVGAKERGDDAMLCYCFGITRADALRDPTVRDYVVRQTGLGLCSCDISNPSGRCCLKDFPRRGGGA